MKSGDIYVHSHGIHYACADFYQLIEIDGRTAVVRKVGHQEVERAKTGPYGYVVPMRNSFIDIEVSIDSMALAYFQLHEDGNRYFIDFEYEKDPCN